MYKWGKYSRGYEVSSKGDTRFCDHDAVLPGGRTILEVYNCDVKGYCPGGTNWKLGDGKGALDLTKDLWEEYLALWRVWVNSNPNLFEELRVIASYHDNILTDMEATTNVNAARALVTILNERFARPEPYHGVVDQNQFAVLPNNITAFH